jgi:predicted  nucleic acid-binding Zn-ribbon protein
MSEDRTQNLPNGELRQILTQLTSINSRLDGMDARLERLEARDYDTKPIWENALKEIADTRVQMREGFENLRGEMDAGLRKVARQIDALNNNILGVQVELRGLDAVVSKLETQAAQ